MPGPTAEPTYEELGERLDHLNKQFMVSRLAQRFAERALEEARIALGKAMAFNEAYRLTQAVGQEL